MKRVRDHNGEWSAECGSEIVNESNTSKGVDEGPPSLGIEWQATEWKTDALVRQLFMIENVKSIAIAFSRLSSGPFRIVEVLLYSDDGDDSSFFHGCEMASVVTLALERDGDDIAMIQYALSELR